MIFFLLFLILLVIILQVNMGKAALETMTCSVRCKDYLVEPDSPFTLVITIENRSRFPVLFLRCSCSAPNAAELAPGSSGSLLHYINFAKYQFSCFLMPHQRLEHTFRLTIPKRGGYHFSGLQISAGDFLGLSEDTASYPGSCSVVILPRKPEGGIPKDVPGGLMGEHSVRRWIHEDPILSVGFREYTGREPLKSVSWNRSLQSGQLMVRQMDHTAEEKVTVLLSMNSGTWEDREVCFSLCRGICEMLEERKLPYAFLHNGQLLTSVGLLPPVEAGLGSNHLNRILEGLGRAVPDVSGDLAMLIRRAMARRQDFTCCLLIVPGITEEVRVQARKLEQLTGGTVEIISGEAEK